MIRPLTAALALLLAGAAAARPLVIAHRGASGSRPEHTLAAYRLAIAQGADFIEADLVSTRDGRLVARHENEIGGTTDVATHPEFAARRTTRMVDGRAVTGWFAEDFTLVELQTLRARERLPDLRPANTAFDGQESVPTLEAVIALVRAEGRARGRTIGLYVETKHPAYFRARGLPLEEPLVEALTRAGYRDARDPLFIESFEVDNLRRLRRLTKLRLVQLMDAEGAPADRAGPAYAAMATPAGLAEVARYADGIGPAKAMVIRFDGAAPAATALVADAHRAGLVVQPWTFRRENAFLPPSLRRGTDPAAHGDDRSEYCAFLAAGVDGLFSDFPAAAVAARAGCAKG